MRKQSGKKYSLRIHYGDRGEYITHTSDKFDELNNIVETLMKGDIAYIDGKYDDLYVFPNQITYIRIEPN